MLWDVVTSKLDGSSMPIVRVKVEASVRHITLYVRTVELTSCLS